MPVNLQDITEEQAVEAFSVCGALIGGYLWRLQHDSGAAPATLPFQKKVTRKKYVSATGAADICGISRSSFYQRMKEARRLKDDSFPKRHGDRFLTAEVEAYDRKIRNKKA